MKAEIKPGLRAEANRVLQGKRTDSQDAVAAYVAGSLAGAFNLSGFQGQVLQKFLANHCELEVSDELYQGWVCTSCRWNLEASSDWPDLGGRMIFDDLYRSLDGFANDEHLRVALVGPSEFYLDLHDPEKPKAASFQEALVKAEDCRAHAQAIEQSVRGVTAEDVLLEIFSLLRKHTIAGKPEDVFKLIRSGQALVGDNTPWTVSALEIARAVLPEGSKVSAETLANEIMKHVGEVGERAHS